MNITRRGFLQGLGAATAIIVPELILPQKTFFLPPAGGWRSQSALDATYVSGDWIIHSRDHHLMVGDIVSGPGLPSYTKVVAVTQNDFILSVPALASCNATLNIEHYFGDLA